METDVFGLIMPLGAFPEDLQQVELVREAIREDLSVAAGPASQRLSPSGDCECFWRALSRSGPWFHGPAISELLADLERLVEPFVEFCGGTHVDRTSEVDDFALLGKDQHAECDITGVVGAAAKQALPSKMSAMNDEVAKTSDDQFASFACC